MYLNWNQSNIIINMKGIYLFEHYSFKETKSKYAIANNILSIRREKGMQINIVLLYINLNTLCYMK